MPAKVMLDRAFLGLRCVLACFAFLVCTPLACGQQVEAYFADSIWTGNGAAISPGVLVVADGKVLAVGPANDVRSVPDGARKHVLGAVTLIPGLVIAQSGLVESASNGEFAISPEVRAVDGFDAFDDYSALLAGGITTVQVSPAANRLIPGQGAVVKLAGSDAARRILVPSESLRIVLTRGALSPPTVYEPRSEPFPWNARSSQPNRNWQAAWPRPSSDCGHCSPKRRPSMAGKRPRILGCRFWRNHCRAVDTVRLTAESGVEVQAALELAAEFKFPWLLRSRRRGRLDCAGGLGK